MDYGDALLKAFPAETYANTLRALREGIASADDAIKGVPLLDNAVGRDYRGLIRRAGIIHRMHAMCVAGDLPFSGDVAPMPRGSWHWLNIRSGNITAHIVRTKAPDEFPDDTPNRQDQRAVNQGDLFDDPKIVRLESTRLYAWLCYKATPNGALAHACWGIPAAKVDGKEDHWLARINLMIAAMPPKYPELDRPTKVDPTTKMKLRDDLSKLSEKNKKNKE